MAKPDSRIAVTVSSGAHRVLLEWWALHTGRSVSSLVSFLLEQSIVEALRNVLLSVQQLPKRMPTRHPLPRAS